MKTIINIALIASIPILLFNCKKEKSVEPEPTPTPVNPSINTGSVSVLFEGMVGDSALVLGTSTYTNQTGNTFKINMYKYYISNIKLTKEDNTVWTEPNSYHLIDYANESTTSITLANVPYGNYKAMDFVIGVDSLRNVSGAQTGALDPAKGMFWTWSSGYIMAKMEGTSPQSTATGNILKFHIGGFSGINNTIKKVSPSFGGETANVTSSFNPSIHMSNNLLEWFKSPNLIDFSSINDVQMPGVSAKNIADNYTDMFTVEHIHNH